MSAPRTASRPRTEQTAPGLARIWRDLRREDLFPAGALAGCRRVLAARPALDLAA